MANPAAAVGGANSITDGIALNTLVNELLQAVRDADNPKQDNTTVAIIKGRCAMRG